MLDTVAPNLKNCHCNEENIGMINVRSKYVTKQTFKNLCSQYGQIKFFTENFGCIIAS